MSLPPLLFYRWILNKNKFLVVYSTPLAKQSQLAHSINNCLYSMSISPFVLSNPLQVFYDTLHSMEHDLERTSNHAAIDERIRILFRAAAFQKELNEQTSTLSLERLNLPPSSTSIVKLLKKAEKVIKRCLHNLSEDELARTLRLVSSSGQCQLIHSIVTIIKPPISRPHTFITKLLSRFSLNDRYFSDETIASAIVEAARRGHQDIVIFLMSQAVTIPLSFLGNAILTAAFQGDLTMIQFLLSDRRRITNEDMNFALINAAIEGHVDVLSFLLFHEATPPIDQLNLQAIIQAAAENGHREAVALLLTICTNLSSLSIEYIFLRAAAQGHLDILYLFLSSTESISLHPMNVQTRHEAIIAAIAAERIEILQILIQMGPIHHEIEDFALIRATGVRREEILNIIFNAEIVINIGTESSPHDLEEVFTVDIQELKTHPNKHLKEICTQGMPTRIRFSNSPRAVDLGGVTKQYITLLCNALRDGKHLQLSSEGIPIAWDKDTSVYRYMGQFFSILYDQNSFKTDKYVTGIIFNPEFFHLVQLLHRTESMPEPSIVATFLKQLVPHYHPFFELAIKPTDELRKQCIQLNEDLYLELDPNPDKAAQDLHLCFVAPAVAFYSGLSIELRKKLVQNGPLAFSLCVQGEQVSSKGLLKALQIQPSEVALFHKHVKWFVEKIRCSNESWHLSLIKAITGKICLHEGMKIKIIPSQDIETIFHFQTCVSQMSLPCRMPLTKEAFLRGLDASLEGDGFNTA